MFQETRYSIQDEISEGNLICVKEHKNIKDLVKINAFRGCRPITSDRGTFSIYKEKEGLSDKSYLFVWSYNTLVCISEFRPQENYGFGTRLTYLREDMLYYSNTTSKLMNYLIQGLSLGYNFTIQEVRYQVKKGGNY